MLLEPGEEVVHSAAVDEVVARNELAPGLLYLTNRRLVFEASVDLGFLRGSSVETRFETDLSAVRDVRVESPRRGRPSIRVEVRDGGARTFKTHDPSGWRSRIARAKAATPPGPSAGPAERPREPRAAASDGPPMVYLHCRHCGSLNRPGNSAGALRCSSCGAAL